MAPQKTSKFERLIVHAIKKLQDIQGSTSKEISNYLSQEYDVPSDEIKRQVRLALSRGVDYGILQRKKGGYYTCNTDYLSQYAAKNDSQAGECSAAYKRWKRSKSRRGRRGKSGKRRSGRMKRSSRGRKRSRRGRSKRGGRRGRGRRSGGKRKRSGSRRRGGRKSRGCH